MLFFTTGQHYHRSLFVHSARPSAARLDRKYIGIELNPEYAEMSRKRIAERVGVRSVEAAEAIGTSQMAMQL